MVYTGDDKQAVRFSIMDPTGNITALVESDVPVSEQLSVAKSIMCLHPDVEQVGFVRFWEGCDESGAQGSLRMAGGEFCGNATMCAAALFSLRNPGHGTKSAANSLTLVRLWVSGAARPVDVRLRQITSGSFEADVHMPPALSIEDTLLPFGAVQEQLPLVKMGGISHVVIEETSSLFWLRDAPSDAERAVRLWCDALGVDGLGLMFLEGEGPVRLLRPLVYVPVGDTVFWESSCASGSSAVGMYLSAKTGAAVSIELKEPGGALRVASDPTAGETWLSGSVRLTQEGFIKS